MERENLERLLAKEADGELAPEDAEALESEIGSDPKAALLAASWRETAGALEGFASDLGVPSEEARERVLAAPDVASRRPHEAPTVLPRPSMDSGRGRREHVERLPRDWRLVLAAAAGLLLALGAGFGIGAAVFARPGSPGAPQTTAVDIRTLREALRETRALMPEQVRWTALCGGRLSLGTSPVPVRNAGAFHFATFIVERSDRLRPTVCQVAVLDGEEAVVEWESDGQWSISCLAAWWGQRRGPRLAEGGEAVHCASQPAEPARLVRRPGGQAVRLWTRVSFRAEGSDEGVTLTAEPVISGRGRVPLVSSRVGGVSFSVSVAVEPGRRPGGREGTTL